MARTTRTFRIFVSSTFDDLKEERNALQRDCFPRLQQLCAEQGTRFQAIDLRWGVPTEAGLDQRTMSICLEEISRCRDVSPRPNFIVLLGDRYGWRPLPEEIEADEFKRINHVLEGAGEDEASDASLVSRWYRRDDNAVPPVYRLQPRTGDLGDFQPRESWESVEVQLREALAGVARRLDIAPDRRLKYVSSAIEQEIERGAMEVEDADEHVFCFLRTIDGLPGDESRFRDVKNGGPDAEAAARLEDLKSCLADKLPRDNIHDEYAARWIGSANENDPPITLDHLHQLCEDVYTTLSQVIGAEIEQIEGHDALETEINDQEAFLIDRAKHFVGRSPILETIAAYLRGSETHPLAMHGVSGSGKSAVMARAAENAGALRPQVARTDAYPEPRRDSGPVVIVRFVGATPGSSGIRPILGSLCQQIARAYGGNATAVPIDYRELVNHFQEQLRDATAERPLALFFDALDQLSEADGGRDLSWLPSELPPHVRVVVSVLDGETLATLERNLPAEAVVELAPMPTDEGSRLLDVWLEDAGRTLQEHQRREVLGRFAACPYPLFLKLAFEEARRWRSTTPVSETMLGAEGENEVYIPQLIQRLFDRLSNPSNHGEVLTRHSLGLLAAARHGLTEDEILDILSGAGGELEEEGGDADGIGDGERDADDVWTDFTRRARHTPPERRLPIAVWSRFYLDLEPYLTERSADGTSVLSFYHRQLREVVEEKILAGEDGVRRHSELARYFERKPLFLDGRTPASRGTVRLPGIGVDQSRIADLRKLSELPFQQTNAGRWEQLSETLTNFDFLEAKCSYAAVSMHGTGEDARTIYGGVFELQEDYRRGLALFPKEMETEMSVDVSDALLGRASDMIPRCLDKADLALVQSALGLSAHTLYKEPKHLGPQLIGRLLSSESEPIQQFLTRIRHFQPTPSLEPLQPTLTQAGGAQQRTFGGHAHWVEAVALSADGRHVVSGSRDKTVKVWELETGQLLRTFAGHTSVVTAVALSTDGRHVVSGSSELKVWELETGRELRTFEGTGPVALSADGRHVVSRAGEGWSAAGGSDSSNVEVKVWELETGRELRTLEGHHASVQALAVSADGRFVVSGSADKTLKVWELETGRELRTLEGHTNSVHAVAVSADGRLVVSGCGDKTLKVWELETGRLLRTFEGHAKPVMAVAVSADMRIVVSGSSDQTMKVWELETGHELVTFGGQSNTIGAVAVSVDGRLVVSGGSDNTVKVWELETGRKMRTFEGHAESVEGVAVSADGRFVVSRCADNAVKVWELETGRELRTFEGHGYGYQGVAVSPDGRYVIAGSSDNTVKVWELETGRELRSFDGHAFEVDVVAVSADGRLVVSCCHNCVKVWEVETGRELRSFDGHLVVISALVLSADGRFIVLGCGDKTVKVWDLETGHELRSFGHAGPVAAVAVSADGRLVVSGSSEKRFNGMVKVWEVEAGQELRSFGHADRVTAVALSADGRLVVSGSFDQTLKVWELETGREVCSLEVESWVCSCAIAPDGVRFVAGDKSGRVHFLRFHPGAAGAPLGVTGETRS